MPLTAAQTTIFFEQDTQMGIPHATVVQLQARMLRAVEIWRNVQIRTLYGAFSRGTISTYVYIWNFRTKTRSACDTNHSSVFASDNGQQSPKNYNKNHSPSTNQPVPLPPFTMAPMSSRSRGVLELDSEVPLFVNWMASNSLEKTTTQLQSIDTHQVKFISGILVQQSADEKDETNTASNKQAIKLCFWSQVHNDVMQPVIATIIDIPNKWTPRVYLCLFYEEVLKRGIISLEIEVSSCRAIEVGRIHYERYDEDYKNLEDMMYQSISYSRVCGGGILWDC